MIRSFQPVRGIVACAMLALLVGGLLADDAKAPTNLESTHKQVTEIAIQGPGTLQHFCVGADGNVVALVGPGQAYGANVANRGGKSEVRICGPTGSQLKSWPIEFMAQAINVAPNGSVWVAGAGQIAQFDRNGKQLAHGESAHLAEVLKDPEKLRKEAAEFLKEQQEMYKEQAKMMQDQVKQLSSKAEDKRSAQEKQMLQMYEQQVKSYDTMVKQLEKKTIEDAVKEIKTKVTDIRCIAASEKDVFIATRMVKGYGYAVWRMTPDLKEPKQIVSSLSGCCGQMDVECCKDCVFVAENSRKRVVKYDRDGKQLLTFGKDIRQEPTSGFGSCCNPMNVCFNAAGDIFTSESDGLVKRFSSSGAFVEFVGKAKVQEGCKNSAIGLSPDGNKVYYIDSQKSKIIVLSREDKPKSESTRSTGNGK